MPTPPSCLLHARHSGAVWQVRWSSPMLNGGLLASCGYDRRVIVWREDRPNTWEKAYVYEGHELSGARLPSPP
jgi:protein transport protein SEC13